MAVERQELIYIPLESGMVVEVMIPEASLNKIDIGMPARVKVDAFPGRVFDGRLVKIGILPDGQSAQLNPDLKLYKCEIESDFKDVTIRPGMSCAVELVKESYEDALYVPVQCVVRVDGVPRVYVNDGGEWVPRIVRVGLDNNRMIHVLEGVRSGEEVMLAPPVKEEKQEEIKETERSKEPARGNGARPEGGAPRKPKTAAAKPSAGRVREPGARKTPTAGGARQG